MSWRASRRNQPRFRERPLGVDPLTQRQKTPLPQKTAPPAHIHQRLQSVFVGGFGPDGLPRLHGYLAINARNGDILWPQGDQVHLDAPFCAIVANEMAESRKVKVGAQLAIDPCEEVEIETGGDAEWIIISRH